MKNRKRPKCYPDYHYKKGDLVCEYVPYPDQPDGPFEGPRRRYIRRRGVFLGNVEQSGYSSFVEVGGTVVEILRTNLTEDPYSDTKEVITNEKP